MKVSTTILTFLVELSRWLVSSLMGWSSTMMVGYIHFCRARVSHNDSFLGTPGTASQMAKDVVTFLSWAAEPEHDERKKMGLKAVIILSTLFALSIYVKRFKWSPIKNRKLSKIFIPPPVSVSSLTLFRS